MDTFNLHYVLARTAKRCFGCRDWIMPGEYYERYTCADGGEVWDCVLCWRCGWCGNNLSAGDFYCEGDLAEDHGSVPADWRARFEAMAREHRDKRLGRNAKRTDPDGYMVREAT